MTFEEEIERVRRLRDRALVEVARYNVAQADSQPRVICDVLVQSAAEALVALDTARCAFRDRHGYLPPGSTLNVQERN